MCRSKLFKISHRSNVTYRNKLLNNYHSRYLERVLSNTIKYWGNFFKRNVSLKRFARFCSTRHWSPGKMNKHTRRDVPVLDLPFEWKWNSAADVLKQFTCWLYIKKTILFLLKSWEIPLKFNNIMLPKSILFQENG